MVKYFCAQVTARCFKKRKINKFLKKNEIKNRIIFTKIIIWKPFVSFKYKIMTLYYLGGPRK